MRAAMLLISHSGGPCGGRERGWDCVSLLHLVSPFDCRPDKLERKCIACQPPDSAPDHLPSDVHFRAIGRKRCALSYKHKKKNKHAPNNCESLYVTAFGSGNSFSGCSGAVRMSRVRGCTLNLNQSPRFSANSLNLTVRLTTCNWFKFKVWRLQQNLKF